MGLFSTRTIISVASSAYGLGGDENTRIDFKNTVALNALLQSNRKRESFSSLLLEAQLRGPAKRQKDFGRWAQTNFLAGTPTASVSNFHSVGHLDFSQIIENSDSDEISITSARMGKFEYLEWCKQRILLDHPERWDDPWSADYSSETGNAEIRWLSGDRTPVEIDVEDRSGSFIYVKYTRTYTYTNTFETEIDPETGKEVYATETATRDEIVIYAVGSGIAELDNFTPRQESLTEFAPFLPLRLNNTSVKDIDGLNAETRAAYKKMFGVEIDEMLEEIDGHDAVDDMDFAFIHFGVSVNTQKKEGLKYIYAFLKNLMNIQEWGAAEFRDWVDRVPDTGEEPVVSTLALKSSDERTAAYDVRLNWVTIEEDVGFSFLENRPVGDIWFQPLASVTWGPDNDRNAVENVALYEQIAPNSWRRMVIHGLVYENYVYKGKAVKETLREALAEEEDDSSLIIPLHFPTLKGLPLGDQNNIALGDAYLLINAYVEQQQKWWQRGIFRFLLAVLAAVIFAPAGVGLLGTHAAVGAALGFAGTAALFVGASVNVLAATLLTQVIAVGAAEIFGDELGSVVAALATYLVTASVQGFATSGEWGIDWAGLFNADRLSALTDVGLEALSGYANAQIADIQQGIEDLGDDYAEEADRIAELYAENIGYSSVALNPLSILQSGGKPYFAESQESFLKRTLLTGDEIAEATTDLISDFPTISLSLPRL